MRLKSTALWYDLPGVEAAYMPIGAPSAVDALMNVGRTDALGNHRMAGRYTATPGVAPAWSAAAAWTFNGSGQCLFSNYIPTAETSVLIRYKPAAGSTAEDWAIGTKESGSGYYGIASTYSPGSGRYWITEAYDYSQLAAPGVAGLSGKACYHNGIHVHTLAGTPTAVIYQIGIGCATWYSAVGRYFFEGSIFSVCICSRRLSSPEMWLASRQMAYCEQNPDWNAWARRRMYFYAPSAAAGRVGIYGARGAVALPGGVRIGTVNDA